MRESGKTMRDSAVYIRERKKEVSAGRRLHTHTGLHSQRPLKINLTRPLHFLSFSVFFFFFFYDYHHRSPTTTLNVLTFQDPFVPSICRDAATLAGMAFPSPPLRSFHSARARALHSFPGFLRAPLAFATFSIFCPSLSLFLFSDYLYGGRLRVAGEGGARMRASLEYLTSCFFKSLEITVVVVVVARMQQVEISTSAELDIGHL